MNRKQHCVSPRVRKQLRTFTDQSSYVLAVQRRTRLLEDNRRAEKHLVKALTSQIALPCAVVVLKRTPRRMRSRILSVANSAVFVATD